MKCVLAIIPAQSWSQMTTRWQITAILMTLLPKCISALKICFFLFFFNWHKLNDKFIIKFTQIESINSELSFDTKNCVAGVVFCVSQFCQETSKKQPQKHDI